MGSDPISLEPPILVFGGPSLDVLPPAERAATGHKLRQLTVRIPSPVGIHDTGRKARRGLRGSPPARG
jgi:hypothetical protein